MAELHFPWLQLAILTPLLGALPVLLLRDRRLAQRLAAGFSLTSLLFGIAQWFDFRGLHQNDGIYEAADRWGLLGTGLGHDWFVVDPFSTLLLPLTALIFLTAIVTTLRTKINRFSFAGTLCSQALVLSTFATQQPWGIVLGLSLSTLPVWVELKNRKQSTRVFVIYMAAMTLLLVVGQAATSLTRAGDVPWFGGFCLTAGLLLRCGIFPLHGWMADLYQRATFGTALLFATPLTGAYGVMRLVFPIAEPWALQSIALLSLFSALYAAGLAMVQSDARRFFCYLFVSHSALLLVGLEMATPIGLTGAMCVWTAIGISMHGFGLALRCVEARTGRLSLNQFHGLYKHTPFLGGMFLLTGLASIGFPGTVGFIGTELLIESVIDVYPLIGFTVVIAAAINGISVVRAYFQVFTGTVHRGTTSMGCRPQERATILLIVMLNVVGGFAPQLGVNSCYDAAIELLEHRGVSKQSQPDQRRHAEAVPVVDTVFGDQKDNEGI